MGELTIQRFKGNQTLSFIDKLAELRIKIFKEYPYLYEGNIEYEREYLKTYTECKESILVIVKDGSEVVGVSTAIPLVFETPECQKPFIEQKLTLSNIFYFGESVLLPQYRGSGIYRQFFHERENAARNYGSHMAVFCAVVRDDNDPRRPKEYVSLNNVWQRFGYQQDPELHAIYQWQEVDSSIQTSKPMVFWTKAL